MKIVDSRKASNEVYIETIQAGETFEYDGKFYIRIKTLEHGPIKMTTDFFKSTDLVFAIHDGIVYYFFNSCLVTPVKTELHLIG